MSNDTYFDRLDAERHLTDAAAAELDVAGFAVIPGPNPENVHSLASAYDAAVASAAASDRSIGRTGTNLRVSGLARLSDFDHVYMFPPLLAACCAVIRQPFKLSTMHARSVLPHSAAQSLHVDFERHADGWAMLGFILMIDDFHAENGATRFVPGSHRWTPSDVTTDPIADGAQWVAACGPAGSLIIFNGSIWHGFGANETDRPRRSIQGAYIRRTEQSATDHSSPLHSGTLEKLGGLGRYLLGA